MFAMAWATFGKWASIIVMVAGITGTYTWLIHKAGKDSMLPKITRLATEYQEFKNQVHVNTLSAEKNSRVLTEVYLAELNAMEKAYVLQIANLNADIDCYNTQRMRDKDRIRAAEDRVSSLSEAAERFAGTDTKSRELSEKLERLEAGILNRIITPAEEENARLMLCQDYLRVVQSLKEDYSSLQEKVTRDLALPE